MPDTQEIVKLLRLDADSIERAFSQRMGIPIKSRESDTMRSAADRIETLEKALRETAATDDAIGIAIGAPARCAQIARKALGGDDAE